MTGSTVEPVMLTPPVRPAEPAPTIVLDRVSVTYAGADRPSLRTPLLRIGEGQLVLVTGPTGSGKSTLLRVLNGLVPHFSGGTLGGKVVVDGRDTRTHRPRELAGTVGLVQQLPSATFVADTVEEEIAYGMETRAVPPSVMRRRVEETLDLLGLGDVRKRRLRELSGGQQQRVAIAAVLAAGPRVLVLDEPTSALDPVAAEDVLSSVQRLVHDLGLTVVLAEHRLERVIHHADAAILVRDGVAGDLLDPAEAMRQSPAVPPVIALGHALGWSPLPLSVRDARRAAASLRSDLAAAGPVPRVADGIPGARAALPATRAPDDRAVGGGVEDRAHARGLGSLRRTFCRAGRVASAPAADARAGTSAPSGPLLEATDLVVHWGRQVALAGMDLTLQAGEVTTVMGRNGAGKSTLLWALAGAQRLDRGRVRVHGRDPRQATPAERARLVGLVPQDPADLLYAQRVSDECRSADQDAGAAPGTTAHLFAELVGPIDPGRHPRDLSEGQRLALALAVVLAASPPILLLDEPTRGLDYGAKTRLMRQLRTLTADGHAIVLATHDVELAAEVSDRIVLLADGEIVADDPSPEVLAGSTAYAPQVSRIMYPVPALTVADVTQAVGRLG